MKEGEAGREAAAKALEAKAAAAKAEVAMEMEAKAEVAMEMEAPVEEAAGEAARAPVAPEAATVCFYHSSSCNCLKIRSRPMKGSSN